MTASADTSSRARSEDQIPYPLRRRPLLVAFGQHGLTLDEMLGGCGLAAAMVWVLSSRTFPVFLVAAFVALSLAAAAWVRIDRRRPEMLAARQTVLDGAVELQVPRDVYVDGLLRIAIDEGARWRPELRDHQRWLVDCRPDHSSPPSA